MREYDLPGPTPRARELHDRMVVFMTEAVLPSEQAYLAHRRAAGPNGHAVPPVVEELKLSSRRAPDPPAGPSSPRLVHVPPRCNRGTSREDLCARRP
jgi:hypothetical protein